MTLYKVVGSDSEDLRIEVNRLFELVSDRLDKIEGFRGEPEVYSRQINKDDLVIDGSGNGVVLKDDADPANYWRVSIDSTGTLAQTSLGREFR